MFNYPSPAENSLHRFSSFQGWYEKISLLLHFPLYQEYGILEASFYFFLILKPNLFLKEWMMAFSQHFVIVFCLFRLRWVFKQFQISSNFFFPIPHFWAAFKLSYSFLWHLSSSLGNIFGDRFVAFILNGHPCICTFFLLSSHMNNVPSRKACY